MKEERKNLSVVIQWEPQSYLTDFGYLTSKSLPGTNKNFKGKQIHDNQMFSPMKSEIENSDGIKTTIKDINSNNTRGGKLQKTVNDSSG